MLKLTDQSLKLTEIQKRCYLALSDRPDWQEVFIELVEKNWKRWRSVLLEQFQRDVNVSRIDDRKLHLIRQIRNSGVLDEIIY